MQQGGNQGDRSINRTKHRAVMKDEITRGQTGINSTQYKSAEHRCGGGLLVLVDGGY